MAPEENLNNIFQSSKLELIVRKRFLINTNYLMYPRKKVAKHCMHQCHPCLSTSALFLGSCSYGARFFTRMEPNGFGPAI